MKGVLFASVIALTMSITLTHAAINKPAVIYDQAGKYDKSFNTGVFKGVKKYMKNTGQKIREFEPKNEAQVEQGLRRLAHRGYSPIVAVGYSMSAATEKVAKDFPNIHFTIIDSVINLPNVQSIIFKEQEGSFLVGALAAMKTKTDTVGFIGAIDIPLIRKFSCGYKQGVKYIAPNDKVISNFIGSTNLAFNDPTTGSELAKSQFSQGANIVFAASGASGLGVYQAAADAGKFAIGVDSNQNYLQPGVMLTSMVKRVDQAAYNIYKSAAAGNWKSGVLILGLADKGVVWALDKYNKELVSPKMKSRMASISNGIIDGKIKVHDYSVNNSCNL